MKLGIHAGAVAVVVIVMASAALVYQASGRIGLAGQAAAEARSASLHTFRAAQTIKSLIHGYELAINEYYSTVLDLPEYRQKVTGLKVEIDGELDALSRQNTHPETAVAQLKEAFGEIEALRQELEGALVGENKDWDLAREALYKLNLVSLQAVQSPDIIAQVAVERAEAMDKAWLDLQSRALWQMRLAMGLALIAVGLTLFGVFGAGRIARQELTAGVGDSAV